MGHPCCALQYFVVGLLPDLKVLLMASLCKVIVPSSFSSRTRFKIIFLSNGLSYFTFTRSTHIVLG
jgi:hypothetical protein